MHLLELAFSIARIHTHREEILQYCLKPLAGTHKTYKSLKPCYNTIGRINPQQHCLMCANIEEGSTTCVLLVCLT